MEKEDITKLGEGKAKEFVTDTLGNFNIKPTKPSKVRGYVRFGLYFFVYPVACVYCFYKGWVLIGLFFMLSAAMGWFLAFYGNRGVANVMLYISDALTWLITRQKKKKENKFKKWWSKRK